MSSCSVLNPDCRGRANCEGSGTLSGICQCLLPKGHANAHYCTHHTWAPEEQFYLGDTLLKEHVWEAIQPLVIETALKEIKRREKMCTKGGCEPRCCKEEKVAQLIGTKEYPYIHSTSLSYFCGGCRHTYAGSIARLGLAQYCHNCGAWTKPVTIS